MVFVAISCSFYQRKNVEDTLSVDQVRATYPTLYYVGIQVLHAWRVFMAHSVDLT